jgi:hypothetical protein
MPCAMPRSVPRASARGGPHATVGLTDVSADAMHDSRMPHSRAWSIWHFVQAGAASRRHDAPSRARWRSPVWWNAHRACLREHDESLRVRIPPPASMTIFPRACRHGHVEAFPSQAYVSSRRAQYATRRPYGGKGKSWSVARRRRIGNRLEAARSDPSPFTDK